MGNVIEAVKCFHCGDECFDEQLYFDEKYFCCHGCRAVYELIREGNLQHYYHDQDLKPVKIADKVARERKFALLDHPDIVKNLIRFRDEKRTVVRFYIASIHCSSCIYLLEHLPKLQQGILRSEVNFIRKEVTITYDHQVLDLKRIALLLSDLGYEPAIHLQQTGQSQGKARENNIGLQIAVAGFCFGNSMLFSLPEYLDTGYQLDPGFKELFGWINLLLMVPVVFFSARDYFISAWKGISQRYLNIDVPITIGIITLVLRSLYEVLMEVGPGYVDSLTGLVFFLLIGRWYQGKSYEALSFERDYTSYFPISVTVLEKGMEHQVLVKDLKAGDEIIIHSQELVPADGMIIQGDANLDYSFVSGESDLVSKQPGEEVYAGGKQVGGPVHIRLSGSVDNSQLTQLWNSSSFTKRDQHAYHTMIDRVSKYFTIAIILIAVLTGAYWAFNDPAKIWGSVTAVLIIACPCALALALPFSYGHAMRILGRKGIYLKNANVVEALARVKQIIFDKTGTLTQSKVNEIYFKGRPLSNDTLSLIRTVTGNSAHPLSKVIAQSIHPGIPKLPLTDFKEELSRGVYAQVNGHKIRVGSAQWLGVSDDHELGESRVYVSLDDQILGYYSIKSAYRKGIFESLQQLRRRYRLHLLSGDNESEKNKLSPFFDQLLFNQQPGDKLGYLHQTGEGSLMVGDGLNDAGALKSASVGFAVSEDIHQFSPSSDAIIAAASIKDLPGILVFSRSVKTVLITAFIISFLYNITGLSFAVTGNLSPIISAILMPVSSVTVVGFITLAVNLLAPGGTKLKSL